MRPLSLLFVVLFAFFTGTASAQVQPQARAAGTPAPAAAQPSLALVELEQLALMALSQADQRAVIALPDGQLLVLKPGDAIARTRATLRQVMADKVVLDETTADGKSVQTAWLQRAQGGKPGRLERLALTAPPSQVASAPHMTVQEIRRSNAPAPARK